MITQEMKDKGIMCKGKGFNCYVCKYKDGCVDYVEPSEKFKDEFYVNCYFCSLKNNGRGESVKDGNSAPDIYIDKSSTGAYFLNADVADNDTVVLINYCPICGRKF